MVLGGVEFKAAPDTFFVSGLDAGEDAVGQIALRLRRYQRGLRVEEGGFRVGVLESRGRFHLLEARLSRQHLQLRLLDALLAAEARPNRHVHRQAHDLGGVPVVLVGKDREFRVAKGLRAVGVKRGDLRQAFGAAVLDVELGQGHVPTLLLQRGDGAQVQVPLHRFRNRYRRQHLEVVRQNHVLVHVKATLEQQQLLCKLRLEAAGAELLLEGLARKLELVGVHRFHQPFVGQFPQLLLRGLDKRQGAVQHFHIRLRGQGRGVRFRHHAACFHFRRVHRQRLGVRKHLRGLQTHEVAAAEDQLTGVESCGCGLGRPKRELQNQVFRGLRIERRRRHHLGWNVEEVVDVERRAHLRKACGQKLFHVPRGHLHVNARTLHGVGVFGAEGLGFDQA